MTRFLPVAVGQVLHQPTPAIADAQRELQISPIAASTASSATYLLQLRQQLPCRAAVAAAGEHTTERSMEVEAGAGVAQMAIVAAASVVLKVSPHCPAGGSMQGLHRETLKLIMHGGQLPAKGSHATCT
jgi:hypothetical protein